MLIRYDVYPESCMRPRLYCYCQAADSSSNCTSKIVVGVKSKMLLE